MICWYDDFLICSYVYGDDDDCMRLYDLPTVDDDTAAWVEDKEERVGKAFQKRRKKLKSKKEEDKLSQNWEEKQNKTQNRFKTKIEQKTNWNQNIARTLNAVQCRKNSVWTRILVVWVFPYSGP